MRKILALLPALFLLGACAGPKGASGSARNLAVTVDTRIYAISKTPDPDFEMAFPDLAAKSHARISKEQNAPSDSGFGYTLAPKGAVYPFSEVEVTCVLREKYASRYGPEICSAFFADLGKNIAEMVKDK